MAVISGDGNPNTLSGSSAADTIFGLGGNAGNGPQTLRGEAGDDHLQGFTRADRAYGGTGDDFWRLLISRHYHRCLSEYAAASAG